MVKACLVYPECYEVARFGTIRKEFPPFGVMYLASSLEKHGVDVQIIPTSVNNNAFNFSEFDLVGFSISSSVVYPLVRQTKMNSKYKKGCITMAGGIHTTLYPEQVLSELDLDIVAIGEGERTICDIADHLFDRDFSQINGIYYKVEDKIIRNLQQDIICNLDSIPFPARHLLPKDSVVMERLSDTKLPIAHILFTRGCPYHCNFCANQNHNIRYRSKENIMDELELLIRDYGIQGFCITDDNFLIDKNEALPIIDEISKLNLKWSTLSRVDTIDRELLEKLKQSGCIEIKYGVESGSQYLLDSMDKGITIEEIKNAFYLTSSVGIKSKALIMHGYPGENLKTTNETINLLNDLREYIYRVGLTYFTYLPGSPIYPENGLDYNYGVYCENQVPWGTYKEKQEVLESRKILKKYIKNNFGSR